MTKNVFYNWLLFPEYSWNSFELQTVEFYRIYLFSEYSRNKFKLQFLHFYRISLFSEQVGNIHSGLKASQFLIG